jgi:signal transduction histidine kinase
MHRLSVRWRITLVAAGLFALALGAASVVLVRTVHDNVVDGIRDSDEQQLAALARQVEDGIPDAIDLPRSPPRDIPEYAFQTRAGRYLVLSDGRVVPADDRARVGAERARDLQTQRIVETAEGQITLISERSLEEVDETIESISDALLVGVPALVLLLGALTWFMAGRALRPVEAIRAEAAAITGSTIHRRVPVPATRDEVAALATTMNGMLDRLEDAASRQRRFVSDASHELRSPVASIRTQLEVGLRRPDADWPRIAERVLAEDARLEEAVADLVELARLDEDAPVTDLAEVDLDEIVLEECRRGRRDALTRVVRNLVDNAARHAETRVAVALRTDGSVVELVVEDDGPGIAPEDRDRVFERFTRLDEGRARDAGGMGLGLAVVRATVERHGGTVAVGDAEPHGARFVVRLPAA